MKPLLPMIMLGAACLVHAGCGSAPKTQPALPEDAERRNELAIDAFRGGRYHDAIQLFEEAERHFLGIDHVEGAANAAISLSEVFLLLNDTENAEAAIGRASARAGRIGDEQLYQRIALLQARLLHTRGQTHATLWILNELVHVEGTAGSHARVLRCEMALTTGYSDCISRLESEPGSLLHARILLLQARAARIQHDLQAAAGYLQQAHAIYRDHRYRPGLAAFYEAAAYLSGQRDHDGEAREQLMRALYLRLWMRDQAHAMELLGVLKKIAGPDDLTVCYYEWQQRLKGKPDWEQLRNEVFKRLQAQY